MEAGQEKRSCTTAPAVHRTVVGVDRVVAAVGEAADSHNGHLGHTRSAFAGEGEVVVGTRRTVGRLMAGAAVRSADYVAEATAVAFDTHCCMVHFGNLSSAVHVMSNRSRRPPDTVVVEGEFAHVGVATMRS